MDYQIKKIPKNFIRLIIRIFFFHFNNSFDKKYIKKKLLKIMVINQINLF